MVIIYPQDDKNTPAPGNAIVFNAQGTKLLRFKVPLLTSPTALERKARAKSDLEKTACFRGVFWWRDRLGILRTAMTIDFDWEWWETRILDPYTGQFGEYISSGRS